MKLTEIKVTVYGDYDPSKESEAMDWVDRFEEEISSFADRFYKNNPSVIKVKSIEVTV